MLPKLEDVIRIRKLLGLTQQDLARLSNVSQSLIAKIETGRVDPSYGNMMKIINALDKMEKEKKIMIRAKDIYSSVVVSVKRVDTVLRAGQLMRDNGFSQLPVFDGDQIVGSVSESTILAVLSEGKDYSFISGLKVGDVIGSVFPLVDEDAPVDSIKSLLGYYQAVLITRGGDVVGIVTKADLLSLL